MHAHQRATGAQALPLPPRWPLSLKYILPNLTYSLRQSSHFVSISPSRPHHAPSSSLFSPFILTVNPHYCQFLPFFSCCLSHTLHTPSPTSSLSLSFSFLTGSLGGSWQL